ncbi:zinc-binding dehydrogenase [Nocardia sp. CA-135953]|uniref:zinc-binding dehydrogenase n=1 Tax=Nocardia sp. CA-135953 TaxID=3239978 RepID=UPI003D955B1D
MSTVVRSRSSHCGRVSHGNCEFCSRSTALRVISPAVPAAQTAVPAGPHRIRVHIDRVISLADVAAAHRLAESGRIRGKLVLTSGPGDFLCPRHGTQNMGNWKTAGHCGCVPDLTSLRRLCGRTHSFRVPGRALPAWNPF